MRNERQTDGDRHSKQNREKDTHIAEERNKDCTGLESLHDERNNNISFLLRQLITDSKKHQHIVAVHNSHSVQIAQHVCTRYLSLKHNKTTLLTHNISGIGLGAILLLHEH